MIEEKLVSYLAGTMTLGEFNRWFVPYSWAIEESDDLETIALAAEIDLRLAEYSNGHWTEDELRHAIENLCNV